MSSTTAIPHCWRALAPWPRPLLEVPADSSGILCSSAVCRDDPFQLLAACLDLAEAMKLPDPREYISHLAVHQDGSCNGLQHYAALGRDRCDGAVGGSGSLCNTLSPSC